MTLQSNAPISLQQIYTEFGAPLGTALTALVRGGAYVPNNSANVNVPTAPPIGLLNFLGASNIVPATVNISPNGGDSGLANGQDYDVNFTANISNGVGPFTFQWSATGVGFSVINATSQTCTLHHNGINNATFGYTLTVTITDQGNGNAQASDMVSGDVTWGTPP